VIRSWSPLVVDGFAPTDRSAISWQQVYHTALVSAARGPHAPAHASARALHLVGLRRSLASSLEQQRRLACRVTRASEWPLLTHTDVKTVD